MAEWQSGRDWLCVALVVAGITSGLYSAFLRQAPQSPRTSLCWALCVSQLHRCSCPGGRGSSLGEIVGDDLPSVGEDAVELRADEEAFDDAFDARAAGHGVDDLVARTRARGDRPGGWVMGTQRAMRVRQRMGMPCRRMR